MPYDFTIQGSRRLVAMQIPPRRAGLGGLAVSPISGNNCLQICFNMANASDVVEQLSSLSLGSSGDDTERSERFWNQLLLSMKFSVEKLWLDAVWNCENKPNYGMRDLDKILEERASNKFELMGPLIDSFLKEIGRSFYSKLGRSRNTGLMPPIRLFIPYTIFRHICNITVGYGGCFKSDKSGMSVRVESFQNASKVFSPVRFQGTNFLKKRHFEKVNENGRNILKYSGRAAVVVGKSTPMLFEYNFRQEKLTVTFYVQRYNKDDFSLDLRLQALINESSD